MRRVLLTGGGGAIGAHVLAHLLEHTDWDVVVLDSFRHRGYRDRIDQVVGDYLADEFWPGAGPVGQAAEQAARDRVSVVQHDLTCPIAPVLALQIGHIDVILHLAALSDVFFGVENPVHVVKNNVDSTLTMLEYARSVNPEAFVYFSTDEVYGPVEEGGAHAEGEPHRPSNAYAASKAACEDICRAWWRSYDVPLIITNTMNNFGEMQAATKFPARVQNIVNAGGTVTIHGTPSAIGSRFYIHSRETAAALLFILDSRPAYRHKIGVIDEPDQYHIVGEKPFTNMELAATIAWLMGKELNVELQDFHHENPAHDIHYGLQDNRLAAAGWKHSQPVEHWLESTINWSRDHPEWMR
jgi:dTDP-glucose 4,6-dehydratase